MRKQWDREWRGINRHFTWCRNFGGEIWREGEKKEGERGKEGRVHTCTVQDDEGTWTQPLEWPPAWQFLVLACASLLSTFCLMTVPCMESSTHSAKIQTRQEQERANSVESSSFLPLFRNNDSTNPSSGVLNSGRHSGLLVQFQSTLRTGNSDEINISRCKVGPKLPLSFLQTQRDCQPHPEVRRML